MIQSKWKIGDKVVFVEKGVGCLGRTGTICEVDNINGRAAMEIATGEKTCLWSDDAFKSELEYNHPPRLSLEEFQTVLSEELKAFAYHHGLDPRAQEAKTLALFAKTHAQAIVDKLNALG